MFNKDHIPPQNPNLNQFLSNLYGHTPLSADQKSVIDKKLNKIDQTIKDKILQTVTVSEYFDKLWKQAEIKQNDKEYVTKKLEAIQLGKKSMIKSGELKIAPTPANLDVVNADFKMTAFEEYNLQEKVKEVRKARKLEIDNGVIAHINGNLDILHALNRPFRSVQNSSAPGHLHYVGGLVDAEDDDVTKTRKAHEFIKKIKKDKKEFSDAVKRAEKSQEKRDLEDLERLRKKEREEEEQKQLARKREHEAHMQKIKEHEDERLHKRAKFEEDYVSKLDKPLYRDIEKKFKRGYVIPELEERKKKLAEIRDFHKPIGIDDINDHKDKVTKLYEEALQKRKEQTEAKWKEQLEKYPNKKTFESPHHKVVAEEISKVRNAKDNERMEYLRRKEKVIELLQDVKDNHIPKTDPQKEAELMNIVNQLNNRNKRKDGRSRTADGDGESDDSLDPKKIGADYLASVKEMVRKKKEAMAKTIKEGGETAVDNTPGKNGKKSALTAVQSETQVKRKNYLTELRQENKIGSVQNQVDNIIKSKKLDASEKRELLQTEVEKLEEKAKRMEQIRKVKHNSKPFEGAAEDDEVDQIYIKAIKAKLEMLGN